MRDLEDEARIKAYMEAKMKHIKMYNECMNLADGLDVEKFAELVRADERDRLAQPEPEPMAWMQPDGKVYKTKQCTLFSNPPGQEKPNQIPLYTAPVHASDISQERVDETAKHKHEWVGFTSAERDEIVPMLVQSLINHDDKTMTVLLRAILIDVEERLKEKNT